MKEENLLIIVSGLCMSGKSKLINSLCENARDTFRPVQICTTNPKPREWYFSYRKLSEEKSANIEKENGFATVYTDVFGFKYGIDYGRIQLWNEDPLIPVLEVNHQGFKCFMEKRPYWEELGYQIRSIFVYSDPIDLEERWRGFYPARELLLFFRTMPNDIEHWEEYDYIIKNTDFEIAQQDIYNAAMGNLQPSTVDVKQFCEEYEEMVKPYEWDEHIRSCPEIPIDLSSDMTDEMRTVWNIVLDNLRNQLPEIKVKTWFGEAALLEMNSDEVIIEVLSQFKRDIILKEYMDTLSNAFAQWYPNGVSITILITDD